MIIVLSRSRTDHPSGKPWWSCSWCRCVNCGWQGHTRLRLNGSHRSWSAAAAVEAAVAKQSVGQVERQKTVIQFAIENWTQNSAWGRWLLGSWGGGVGGSSVVRAQIELESDFRYDSFITILINSTIITSSASATGSFCYPSSFPFPGMFSLLILLLHLLWWWGRVTLYYQSRGKQSSGPFLRCLMFHGWLSNSQELRGPSTKSSVHLVLFSIWSTLYYEKKKNIMCHKYPPLDAPLYLHKRTDLDCRICQDS